MKNIAVAVIIFWANVLDAQQVSVAIPSMNVIYVRVETEVKIAVEGYKNTDLVFETSGVNLLQKEGKYYVKGIIRGDAYLYTGLKRKSDTLWLDTTHFRVRKLPHPLPQLGTLGDGAVESIGTIKANAIRVFLSIGYGFALENLKAVIENYKMVVVDSNSIGFIEQPGNSLTQARDYINKLAAEGKIYVYEVNYVMTYKGDTVRTSSLLEDGCEITARYTPTNSNFLFLDEKTKQELIARHQPAFNIAGGFSDTDAQLLIEGGKIYMQEIIPFSDKIKHGRWTFSSGICNPIPYKDEYYDSGRLIRYVAYDSAGFKMTDIEIPANADSVYYKEKYPNGKIRREGWVALDPDKYSFYGESNHCAAPRQFVQYYKRLKFVPIGHWKEYYENGTLKLEGNFVPFEYSPEPGPFDIDEPLIYNTVYLHGTWSEYDNKGNLIHQYHYNKGFY